MLGQRAEVRDSTRTADVSILIPVLNEEDHVRDAVAAMQAQDFDGEIEFLFIDGGSADRTRAILEELAVADPRIRLLDNPERRTPQALNIGLRAATGEFVARMDAHTYYPPDYVARGVERLRAGGVDWVSGPQLAKGVDEFSRRVALALSGTLGTGGARFRREMNEEIEVDSGFTGIWRRETLERYDGWDEDWPIDQDYELAARMRKDGGRIVCLPEMAADYSPRNSYKGLWKQYWSYGVYRVKTSNRHPESMRRSHVLPPGLALAAITAVAAPRPLRMLARLGLTLYSGSTAFAAAKALSDGEKPADAISLPPILATMHFSFGFGFLRGCVLYGPPLAALRHLVRGSR